MSLNDFIIYGYLSSVNGVAILNSMSAKDSMLEPKEPYLHVILCC